MCVDESDAAMNATQPAPAPLKRPKLAQWLWERDLDFRTAAGRLGRSREWVRLICLPFDDPRRRIPDQDDMARIHALTEGEVGATDFYPQHLQSSAIGAANDGRL